MVSTYTSPLGIEKPALNDYFNTWHTPANLNFDMLADAVAGVTDLALTGDTTLAITNGADSTGRAAILNVTSSDQHDRVITVPAVSKTYRVRNASSYRVKIKPTAGTATDIMPGTICDVLVTATHCYRMSTSGWGLHSNTVTTSGASVTITLTGLGQHFNDIRLIFNDVNPQGGALQYQLRTDAAAGGTARTLISSTAIMGALDIANYRASYGAAFWALAASAASPSQEDAAPDGGVWRVTGGIGSIVISDSGATFGAGSIDCYLR